jgi:putative glutamine amidotransferase
VPVVAVLTGHFPSDRASVHRSYLSAVWLAGGQPVMLSPPPPGALGRAIEVVERCDALLLTGGGDVDPARYGQAPSATLMAVDETRDTFELAAVDHCLAIGRPVLGICRGLQVLAVALGGRLHQDVATAGYEGHWDDANQHAPVHGIRATPGSLAERSLAGHTKVNSVHHQAVADPGEHLVASAWADDDLIEAVEAAEGGAFGPLLGVQWHPERMLCPPDGVVGDPRHLAPFTWLVEAAAAANPGSVPATAAGPARQAGDLALGAGPGAAGAPGAQGGALGRAWGG